MPTKLIYYFCPYCGDRAWLNEDHSLHHKNSTIDYIDINGVTVVHEVVNHDEENKLTSAIDKAKQWVISQEGRRKQDYGPRVNFLARKVSLGNFNGFPLFARNLLTRIQQNHEEALGDFIPVEFCILEYTLQRGSYIRPHYDDKWIWGDRLVTVNLLSETILRLTKEFNLPPYEIAIKMPARSLVIISGEARYDWHHSINKYDIKSRRIAMTWREFSTEVIYDPNYSKFVGDVFKIASFHHWFCDSDVQNPD